MDDDYKAMLGKCPILTREEEYDAWERGDTDLLVRSQLPWVVRVAYMVCQQCKFRDDALAISAANLALMEAVKKFDPRTGNRFTTYLFLPVTWRVRREIAMARQGTGPTPRVRKNRGIKLSLLGECDIYARDRSVEVNLGDKDAEAKALHWAIGRLTARQATIVRKKMAGMTHDQIGAELGVSKQAIQQQYQGALRKLKEILSRKMAA